MLSGFFLAAQFEPFVDKNMRLLYTRLDELFISTAKACDYHNWVQYCEFHTTPIVSRELGELMISRYRGLRCHLRDDHES